MLLRCSDTHLSLCHCIAWCQVCWDDLSGLHKAGGGRHVCKDVFGLGSEPAGGGPEDMWWV
jgi:hypothetical protein